MSETIHTVPEADSATGATGNHPADNPQSDSEPQTDGSEVVRQLFVLLKVARTHGLGNSAWDPPMERLRQALGDATLLLKLSDNALYLGEDGRIRMDRDVKAAEAGLIEAFNSHGVAELSLQPGFTDAGLQSLLCAWGGAVPDTPEEGFEVLERLAGQDPHVDVVAGDGSANQDDDAPAAARAIYACTMHAVEGVMDSIKVSKAVPLKRAKRVIHRLVDQLLAEPSTVLGLTTLRCYDEYTYHHSVNVCVLSLAMGRRLGLSKPMLAQLGMAALFHDLGKSEVPSEVLNKPDSFTEDEWQMVRQHPVDGVKILVRLKGTDPTASRVVTGAFEHHMNMDHSGYPQLPTPRQQSLFGRIISLADCYDAMTSSRVYNRTALTPERALRFMLNKAGSAFDPVLIKVFVATVGIIPVGSLLLLDGGELAVVMAAHDDPALSDRPTVRIITDAHGTALETPQDASLADSDESGKYLRDIERVVDGQQYGIDTSQYFL